MHLDILGLGCVAVDDLLYVPAYPPADAKVRVNRRERQCGGLTGTALVAAARMGARCAYAGVLGDDPLSQFVEERFRQEGVDTAHIRRRQAARPIHSVIVVDEGRQTRNIFYDLDGVAGAEQGWPHADVIRSARVLFVDHFGVEGMTWAARIARASGVAVVADFEVADMPGFADLLALVDHLIISLAFARQLTGEVQPELAAKELWNHTRQAVVLTDGAAGCWYLTATEPCSPRRQPAFRVEAVDTTGCGDVFHGAYATALVGGRELPECIRFAAAAAAIKATRRGGQSGIPTRSIVEAFLQQEKSS
jgi:sugar/nucleoside kinase (ribokinase family)